MDAGLVAIIVAALGLVGAGGFVSLVRLRHDKKLDLAKQEGIDDDAIVRRWEAFARTQTEALVEPLRSELTSTKEELSKVKGEVEELRKEVKEVWRRYWRAIAYIRQLLMFMERNALTPPTAPADIAEDI